MKDDILSLLSAECPWRDTLHWYNTIDSTNTRARELAAADAPHGTVLIAGQQTGGKGRLGRSFSSPAGMGAYLSVILRPQCPPSALMHLTCAAAAAICKAIEAAAGFRPGIKWTNDLVCNNKKLGGILTELSVCPQTGLVDYAIIGIGINCRQKREDFPTELQSIATSAAMVTGKPLSPLVLAAAMIHSLAQMDALLFESKAQLMEEYRTHCITLGREIVLLRGDEKRYGKALDITADGALLVQFDTGTIEAVQSGEVSIRGMYGYI